MPPRNPKAELKAKEKRQKIIAAAGGVVLIALVAFQGPKTLDRLHQKAPAPAAASPSGSATVGASPSAPATSTPGAAGAESPATAGRASLSALAVFDVAPEPAEGQLGSFSRFVSRDPFRQQLDVDAAGRPIAPAGGSSSSPASGSAPTQFGSGGPDAQATAAASTASISVNRDTASVAVGSDFPAASPYFHLVSATATSARVSIAGGSYADGRATVTLRLGRPVTLQNTGDGSRYMLLLVGVA